MMKIFALIAAMANAIAYLAGMAGSAVQGSVAVSAVDGKPGERAVTFTGSDASRAYSDILNSAKLTDSEKGALGITSVSSAAADNNGGSTAAPEQKSDVNIAMIAGIAAGAGVFVAIVVGVVCYKMGKGANGTGAAGAAESSDIAAAGVGRYQQFHMEMSGPQGGALQLPVEL